jgi:hypothetical protein
LFSTRGARGREPRAREVGQLVVLVVVVEDVDELGGCSTTRQRVSSLRAGVLTTQPVPAQRTAARC